MDKSRQKTRLGVHVSIAGGLHLSLHRAQALGCSTMQIFSHNPRGWSIKPVAGEDSRLFRKKREELDLRPVFVHVSYLLNIASPDEALRKRSTDMLRHEMERADIIGAEYVVLHTGTAHDTGGWRRAVESLNEVLVPGPYKAGLLLENTSGKRGDIASRVEHLSRLMEGAGGRPAGVCIDTCHAFAAGYEIRRYEETERLGEEIVRMLGKDVVRLIHLNDSKGEAGTGTDRHEHLGKGHIGDEGLRGFLLHPVFRGVPVVLETPKRSDEDDLRNLAAARRLMDHRA